MNRDLKGMNRDLKGMAPPSQPRSQTPAPRATDPVSPWDRPGIEWQRPHPLSLIILFVSSLRDLFLPILILFLGGGDAYEFIFLLSVAVTSGFAIARYFSTRYALTDEALLHNHGVLMRNRQVLPRRNIQNLSTSAGLVARATGLVEFTASDASAAAEINIRLLSTDEADRLMTLLRADTGPARSDTIDTHAADSDTIDTLSLIHI